MGVGMYNYDRTAASNVIKDRVETVLTIVRGVYRSSKGDDFDAQHTYEVSVALRLKIPVHLPEQIFEAEVVVSNQNSLLSVTVENKRAHPIGHYVEWLLRETWLNGWVDDLPPHP
jgi:hypothetical protein